MSVNLVVINGPNLNMLGVREKGIYGQKTLEEINQNIKSRFSSRANIEFFQSNHEGGLVDFIHGLSGRGINGIVINAGAYTHTSVAIRDALLSIQVPFIEVHISNVYKREEFRQTSYLSDCAIGLITGLGDSGYSYALDYFIENIMGKTRT